MKQTTLDRTEFSKRRAELMSLMEQDSIAIIPGGQVQYRNHHIQHRFRQDSDFHYLTGFDEPDAVFVLVPGRSYGEAILFCREREDELERWHGAITGPERAMQLFGMDDAFPIDDMDDILPGLIEGRSRLYYAMGGNSQFDERIIGWVKAISADDHRGSQPPGDLTQLDPFLHELRLFKSANEMAMLRRASRITTTAHLGVIAAIKPGKMEYEVEAELNYQFTVQGARSPAYPSIVGGGENACILHYTENNQVLKAGDLVLIDAGCEYEYYASDVTRTLPVSGRFSEPQKKLYEVVLAAQEAAFAEIRPGNHWNQPHEAAVREITAGLVRLGILEGSVDDLLEAESYKQFFMHRTGHWLGLDVHDVGEYKIDDQWRVFEQGMVGSIEPGLYIPSSNLEVPPCYRGIGIRIEDNVLVTRSGMELLTAALPRGVTEIENLMAGETNAAAG